MQIMTTHYRFMLHLIQVTNLAAEQLLSFLQTFFFHLILISTRFPAAGLSTSHIRADWLHDWSSAAKWARLLITYLVAALSNT